VGGAWWRLVPGTAFAVGAVVLARRGRVGEASLLASVFVVVVSGAIGAVLPPEILRARTADSIAGVTSLVAMVVLVVTAALLATQTVLLRPRLDRRAQQIITGHPPPPRDST
jgi:cyanate permease